MIVKEDIKWEFQPIEGSIRIVGSMGWRFVVTEAPPDLMENPTLLQAYEAEIVDWFNGRGERGVGVPFCYPVNKECP